MNKPEVICIGSALWDVIGQTEHEMPWGSDKPGEITRRPGGVALNVAVTLKKYGRRAALLSVIGTDDEGQMLMEAGEAAGLRMEYVLRSKTLPTDRYMAIESPEGLVAAIADARSLEQAGDEVLEPMRNARLGSALDPWKRIIALDGNLTEALLGQICEAPEFSAADLRVVPASPGKARRLLALKPHPKASFYVNLAEAGLMLDRRFSSATSAAQALVSSGVHRAIVTNGGETTADATADGVVTAMPPAVRVTQVTGAGDSFMAAHIAAEMSGSGRSKALRQALDAAARHVSGETK